MERRIQEPRRAGLIVMLSAALAATPAVAGPAEAYYERSLMTAAQARCGLFAEPVARALEASAAQARGAALRGGLAEAELNAVGARAQARAASTACDAPDLHTAAERVRGGFEGWTRTSSMTFPDAVGDWAVERTAYRSQSWRMRQDRQGLVFGFAGAGAGHTLALTLAAERAPASVRIVVRDPSRAGAPWLTRDGVADTPPRSASKVFMAGAGRAAPETLAPEGGRLYRFSTATADAIAALDPRERFLVEIVEADGATRTVTLGVGDFAAARAFLAMGTL